MLFYFRVVAAITVESTPEGSLTPPPLIRNSFHQCPVRVPLNPACVCVCVFTKSFE